jgi:hypothetical protein
MVAVHVERLDHLARLLPTPKRAKVELGSGITAGSALRYPLVALCANIDETPPRGSKSEGRGGKDQ